MKAIEKIKNKVLKSKTSKYVATAMFAAAVAVMGCINCFATDGEVNVGTIMQTAFNTVKTDITNYVGVALPIALGVFALLFGIKKAISFFKSVASK